MRDRAIGVVSSGFVLCLFTLAMVWGVLSSGMVGKMAKISDEYNTVEALMLLIVVLEKILERPLDCKEIKPVTPKGNQPWIFTGRTDTEASILRPSDVKSWLTGKDPDAGKDWRQETKETREEYMAGWHHWLNGHEFEQTVEDSEGQGSLACCSPWGRKESNMTKRMNDNWFGTYSSI